VENLTDELFEKYCDLVSRETGIKLTHEKRELLDARIGKRLRARDVDADHYYTLVQDDPHELRTFISAISAHNTYFFRESKSFAYLDRNRTKIWCAASSSGEEPYSLATYCLDRGFRPAITATDISDISLETGRRGIYPKQCVANLPRHLLKSYFTVGDGDHVQINEDVQRLVTFKRLNLLKETPPVTIYDMVFCRNILLYFDVSARKRVVGKLVGALKTGGYLIIGTTENLSNMDDDLECVEPGIYLKI
jgi:chemotaxis protein methyltransferase CheR